MTSSIQAAADMLLQARTSRSRITLPDECRPADADAAYAIQAIVEGALGRSPVAWKVGAPDAHSTPSAAPIYDVVQSGAHFRAGAGDLIGVEAELAAVFGRELPARNQPYAADEVNASISEVRVVIEVCDSRIAEWQRADDATKLADHGLNLALVVGTGVTNPLALDCTKLEVRTLFDGEMVKQGIGTHAVGNPFLLLPWLANHARLRGGIRAGTVVTLGAWLGLHTVEPGTTVTVAFPAIGKAEAAFTA